jgi:ATP-dependent DNA helicase UvrD/PcrA
LGTLRQLAGRWSLAILVKSRDLMLKVSSYLGSTGRLPEIAHDVLIDPEGPALAAVLIGGLLEGAFHAVRGTALGQLMREILRVKIGEVH